MKEKQIINLKTPKKACQNLTENPRNCTAQSLKKAGKVAFNRVFKLFVDKIERNGALYII